MILPWSDDTSIREKAISILQTFFIDWIILKNSLYDVEEESDVDDENEQSDQQYKEMLYKLLLESN